MFYSTPTVARHRPKPLPVARMGLLVSLLLSSCSGETELSPTPALSPTPTPSPLLESPVLNELSCQDGDWVELYNPTQKMLSLTGFGLTDDPSLPERTYTFPPGATLAPGEFWVVEASSSGEAGLSFGLKCGEDTLTLLKPSGEVVEQQSIPALPEGATWGRLPDGTGAFAETAATQAAFNQRFEPPPPPLNVFDLSAVPTIDIGLSPEAVSSLYADPYTYVPGKFQFTHAGVASETLEVGVRLKSYVGSFQSLDGKAAFKISFNEQVSDQRWEGLKRLTLNNMVQDASMVHEAISYAAFRALGLPASRLGYAWVRVNGEDYGLYTNVETLDEISLPQWFSSTGHLYEGAYGADVYPGAEGSFEIDEGSEEDVSDLTALIEAANSDDAVWLRRMEQVADLDQLLLAWATELYLGHWDGYPTHNNYYLHADDAGFFSFLPWGTDQTLLDHRSFLGSEGYMFQRCLAIADCKARYYSAVQEVGTQLGALQLELLMDEVLNTITPYIKRDPRKPFTSDDVVYNQTLTREFLVIRPDEASSWLDCVLNNICEPCLPLELETGKYAVCTQERSWSEARAYCEQQGLSLVALASGLEERSVTDAAAQFGLSSVWIGANDLDEEGVWRWPDGSPLLYAHWGDGEPNNSGEEDCAELVYPGYWNDLPCSTSRAAVCEAPCTDSTDQDGDGFSRCTGDCNDAEPLQAPDQPEQCDDGIDQDCSGAPDDGPTCPLCTPLRVDDALYRICSVSIGFDEARATCEALNMQLAAPATDERYQALWSALASAWGGLDAWLGLTDLAEEGSWTWLNGEPIAYSRWASGQPDNAGEEDCGGTFYDGSWNDYPCWYPLGAICEEVR